MQVVLHDERPAVQSRLHFDESSQTVVQSAFCAQVRLQVLESLHVSSQRPLGQVKLHVSAFAQLHFPPVHGVAAGAGGPLSLPVVAVGLVDVDEGPVDGCGPPISQS